MDDIEQYSSTANLDRRIALHEKYGGREGLSTFHNLLHLAPGSRVLEVGCGTGRFWEQGAHILPSDLELVLTDTSLAMIQETARRVEAIARWSRIETKIADIAALPFLAEEFETVLAMHVLYHVADRTKAVDEIARVLRPGGQLILTTNGKENLRSLFDLAHRAFGGPKRDPGAQIFGLEDVETVLSPSFGNIRITVFEDQLRITDPRDVVAYLASTPAGRRATTDQLAALGTLVQSAFQAQDGVLLSTRVTGFATATRLD